MNILSEARKGNVQRGGRGGSVLRAPRPVCGGRRWAPRLRANARVRGCGTGRAGGGERARVERGGKRDMSNGPGFLSLPPELKPWTLLSHNPRAPSPFLPPRRAPPALRDPFNPSQHHGRGEGGRCPPKHVRSKYRPSGGVPRPYTPTLARPTLTPRRPRPRPHLFCSVTAAPKSSGGDMNPYVHVLSEADEKLQVGVSAPCRSFPSSSPSLAASARKIEMSLPPARRSGAF
jgi:hypothetical protein